MLSRVTICLCFAPWFNGCIQTDYDLELTPQADRLKRSVHVHHQTKDAAEKRQPDDERIAKEYGRESQAGRQHQNYDASFTGRLPFDIGGHGTYTHFDTPLGSVSLYLERFRGDADLAGILERRKAAVDHLVTLLIGWLGAELAHDPNWPQFSEFLGREFRRDLFNLSLNLWHESSMPKPDALSDPAMKVLQHLVEREYLQPDELPAIQRAIRDAQHDDHQRLLGWVRRLIVARLNDQTEPAPELPFLESWPKLQASLRKYLATTEEYGIARTGWLENKKTNPAAEEPDPLVVFDEVLRQNFAGILQLGGDQLTVTLNLDRPAISTNGENIDGQKLEWPAYLLPNGEMPPRLLYAVWDEPNDLTQQLLFGGTVLSGERLLTYAMWYAGLSDAERTAWDEFLAGVSPGPDLLPRLRAFRFPGEAADLEAEQRLSKPAVEVVERGLKK